jgi:hypothetical protein
MAALLALALLGACQRTNTNAASAEAPDAVKNVNPKVNDAPSFNGLQLYTGPHRTPKGMKGLTIVGYNYTDTYIHRFAVNGAGGGNIEVAQGDTYGGGTCCAPIVDDMPLPITVEISWKRDGDVPSCKQTVLLDGPLPKEPNYFEVHFYQDGTIQVAITDYPSPARVKLQRFNRLQRHANGNVDNDTKFSECKSGR